MEYTSAYKKVHVSFGVHKKSTTTKAFTIMSKTVRTPLHLVGKLVNNSSRGTSKKVVLVEGANTVEEIVERLGEWRTDHIERDRSDYLQLELSKQVVLPKYRVETKHAVVRINKMASANPVGGLLFMLSVGTPEAMGNES